MGSYVHPQYGHVFFSGTRQNGGLLFGFPLIKQLGHLPWLVLSRDPKPSALEVVYYEWASGILYCKSAAFKGRGGEPTSARHLSNSALLLEHAQALTHTYTTRHVADSPSGCMYLTHISLVQEASGTCG